ncbi:MAG: A/G-specific adenine glycosylase [Acidobacteriota bacterium]
MRRSLLRFYDRGHRDLPWRRTSDPYRILVSEVMLQQTTVSTAIPYYQDFITRFPDAASLAAAREEDVLAAWSGLGYYSRARNLVRTCREIVATYGGEVPQRPDQLRALPGVGPYTAGAVASIAFSCPEPALDGNVARVLCRLAATPGQGSAERRRFDDTLRELLRGRRPGDLNQALMDLGATVCTPRRPACSRCPVRRHCAARSEGAPEKYPAIVKRPRLRQVSACGVLIRRKGGVVLVQRPEGVPLAGMWELPGVSGLEEPSGPLDVGGIERVVAAQTGLSVSVSGILASVRHTVMRKRIVLDIRGGMVDPGARHSHPLRPRERSTALLLPRTHRILRPDTTPALPLSTACRKSLAAVDRLDLCGTGRQRLSRLQSRPSTRR